jgi:hypothetical protein
LLVLYDTCRYSRDPELPSQTLQLDFEFCRGLILIAWADDPEPRAFRLSASLYLFYAFFRVHSNFKVLVLQCFPESFQRFFRPKFHQR